jgi:hypothetical protein
MTSFKVIYTDGRRKKAIFDVSEDKTGMLRV